MLKEIAEQPGRRRDLDRPAHREGDIMLDEVG